jgi:phosphoglucosamine mutase
MAGWQRGRGRAAGGCDTHAAVAYLVGAHRADLGVALSGSHNPMPDNSLKLFAAGERGCPTASKTPSRRRSPVGCGGRLDTRRAPRSGGCTPCPTTKSYVDHLLRTIPHRLDGLKVVVDCANGAASRTAPEAYRRAGADVVALHCTPDGLNINDGCGSTYLSSLQNAVVAHGADLGIAHDGDADRCLAVTARGAEVDGDQIMAILALAMRRAGRLTDDTLVATVMSNLGLRLAMRQHGITLVETRVGDRYVLEKLRAGGYALGGEQSGHVVVPAHATTGDGLLTALHLMAEMAATGRSLAELASVVTKLPQVLLNVRVGDKTAGATAPVVTAAVADAAASLGDSGGVLLRPSGTERWCASW